MAKPDGRIEKGQRLSTAISARAWNRAQDAADIVLGARPGISVFQQPPFPTTYQWVYSRNISNTVAIARHDAVRLDGLIAGGNQADDSFAYNCVSFSVGDVRLFPFGVALESIAPGSIGKVAISGAVKVLARINHNEHRFLRTVAGSARLETSVAGEARLLTRPSIGVEPLETLVTAELGRFYESFIGVWDPSEGLVWNVGQTKNINTVSVGYSTVPVLNLSANVEQSAFSSGMRVLVQPVRQRLPIGAGTIFDGYVLVGAQWNL